MESILENTSDSIWAIDRNYQILYLNDAFKTGFNKAFGIDLRLGDIIIEKLPNALVDVWKNRYKRALSGVNYAFDDSFSDRNDNTIYIHVLLSPIRKDKEVTGITCFGRDVTQERLNEIALQKYSVLLKSSIESQKDTILLSIDKEYRYLYFNSAHYEVMKYAYNKEIEIGMNILECITDIDDRKAAEGNYSRALKGESHSNIRVYGITNKEYYESFFNPIKDKNDDIIGATALARNITKRIEQEEALRVANATKDKFFSIISHDLRSPISSIRSLANMIYGAFEEYSTFELKTFLKSICKGLDSTYILLEDLLLWSQVQKNAIVFNPDKINLSDISDQIIDIFNQNLKSKELTLKRNYPPSFNLNADKQMISTIIRNLFSNAIKFSHKKGNIEIGFQRLKEGNAEKVLIYVSDSGVGISKENISKLFNIGEDISTSGTEKEKGTGLGLIMCKEFIDKHNGEIIIDSEINKGTKISIILPK